MPEPKPATTFLDAVWLPRAIIWVVMLVLGLALVLTLAPGQPSVSPAEQAIRFGLVALVGLWIAVLLLGGLHLCRGLLSNLAPLHVGWIALLMLLGITAVLSAIIAHFFMPDAQDRGTFSFVLRNVAIAGVLGTLGLGVFQTIWNNLRLRRRAEASEIAALRAVTRPHFLFNTLNTAVALVRQRPEAVEELLLDLSDLFRASIRHEQECSLEHEIDLTRKYLHIEQLRFGPRLEVEWLLPDPLPEALLPTLALQTLVENAVRHGIEGRARPGRIAIRILHDAEALRISVSNDLPESPGPGRGGHGLGLQAVKGRIHAFSHGAGQIHAATKDGKYEVAISLPLPRRDGPAGTPRAPADAGA